jgi:hypothetical protein
MSNLGLSTPGDLICKSGMLELYIDTFGCIRLWCSDKACESKYGLPPGSKIKEIPT